MRVRREEMNATTLCPTCNTRFKVSQAQLDAHQGLVRCGRCQAVFNATEFLQEEQPSPRLDLLATPQQPVETSVEPHVDTASEPASAMHEELDFSLNEAIHPEWQDAEPQGAEQQLKIEPAEPITLAQKVSFADSPGAPPSPIKKKNAWPWLVASLLLLLMLLAQATYFFRVELAANLPGLKPALIAYCRLLQCSVPLPQHADLVSIESSDLEADPAQASVISLNALLRNHAPYAQAYPNLELTLTDAQDKPLARRTFGPAEYLRLGEDTKQGLAANRELGVKLNLDTTDLKPSGYRLFLFYPQ